MHQATDGECRHSTPPRVRIPHHPLIQRSFYGCNITESSVLRNDTGNPTRAITMKDWRYWFESRTFRNKYIVGREAMHGETCNRMASCRSDATAGWRESPGWKPYHTNGGQLRRERSVVSKASDGSAIQIKTSPMLQEGNAERYYLNIEIENDWNIYPHGFGCAGFSLDSFTGKTSAITEKGW